MTRAVVLEIWAFTPGALLLQGPLGSRVSEKVPLEHCCARSAWIQGLRKGTPEALLRKVCLDPGSPKRYPWSIVAQGPLGSRVSEKVPLEHCCTRSAWIQGLRKGTPGALLRKARLDPRSPKRYPWSIVAQGPLGSRVSEKVPLEHCCARSAWIQGLRKGTAWIQGLRKGTPGALLRKVRLDPGSPKRYLWSIVAQGPLGSRVSEKVPLEHCCATSAWIQGLRQGTPKKYILDEIKKESPKKVREAAERPPTTRRREVPPEKKGIGGPKQAQRWLFLPPD